MIKITERFYLDANANCYTLQEKTTVQDEQSKNFGKEIFKDLGYYVSIDNAIRGLLKTELREFVGKEEINEINELLQQIKKQDEFLKTLKLDI